MKSSLVFSVLTCVAMVLLTGCPDDSGRVIVPKPSPKPVLVCSDVVTVSSSQEPVLRAAFISRKHEDAAFSNLLCDELSMGLLPRHARIVVPGDQDISIIVDPSFEVFDKSGSYVRVKCNYVTLKVCDKRQRELFAIQSITPPEMPRQLGEEAAKCQYVKPVAALLRNKFTQALDTFVGQNVAVREVTISSHELQSALPPNRPVDFLKYPVHPGRTADLAYKIGAILDRSEGVIDWMNVGYNKTSGACVYRITYMKSQYKNGIDIYLTHQLGQHRQ